jgi:hypothetical protein
VTRRGHRRGNPGESVKPSPFFLLFVPPANKVHQKVPAAVGHRHPVLLHIPVEFNHCFRKQM